jgi:predicted ATPase
VGSKTWRSYFLALLAEASSQAAQPETGLTVLADACPLVAETEARWWEAELYRLREVLLCQLSRPEMSQAEVCFQQALDVARRQQARALEFRAEPRSALGGSREADSGPTAAGRDIQLVHEGFDTPDLQEATALLEECT